ncbi:hypothetical protein AYO20_00178 [Fonsecaea nubica]|uniref:Alpha/beta hydrolase fold-3 domain-containing protein n=1 Tax=Fonsecaea nubica TaxID=856822 RepID=A0A178DFI4_9EURO|nr:hypothetical protein AYO20_00178 [Fonsecaea nubica]OAL40442.1 hypothetical protein AYO20_00178 [Fonsecaea nubica]
MEEIQPIVTKHGVTTDVVALPDEVETFAPSSDRSQADYEREELAKLIRSVFDSFKPETTFEEMRAGWESMFHGTIPSTGATSQKVETPDFKGEWITAPEAELDRAVVYLHGGGYCIGSITSYRDMCERLSKATKSRVLAVDYRLAPEHPFPAALDDAVSAYRWVLSRGISPQRVAIAGDSAGGNLTLATMFVARESGDPLPACAVPISPWIDLEHKSESMTTMDELEPMCHKAVLDKCADLYLPSGDKTSPLLSALNGDLTGLPPLFVPVGGSETLLDDARALALKAKEANVPVELKIYDRQFHVFQIFASRMAEAQSAIDDIGRFVLSHIP